MILWVVLFILVVAISFVLALKSMRDFQEIPQSSKVDYGLFLVRKTENLSAELLDSIRKFLHNQGLIVSMERLFKGKQSALTIFGPKDAMKNFGETLSLLELEDYAANLEYKDISTWEVGVRDAGKFNPENINNIFNNLPSLEEEDQFFWQVVIGKDQSQIRAVLYTKDLLKRKTLEPILQNLALGELVKIPKPFSNQQMMDFYRLRTLSKDSKAPILDSEGILRLLKIA